MKSAKYLLIVLSAGAALSFTACANGGNEESKKNDTTVTPTGPAPDNSAATNSSLGDTLHDNKDTNATKKDTTKH
jgi:hypothetical protein